MIRVLNEEIHALRMQEEGLLLKDSLWFELSLLAKYFLHREKLNKPQTKEKLIEFCKKFIPNFDEINYRNTINNAIKEGKKLNFINVKTIEITNDELELIDRIKSIRAAKIMFVLLVIVKANYKLMKLINEQKEVDDDKIDQKAMYTSDSISSVVKLSMTALNNNDRYKVLRDLKELGYIDITTKGKVKVLIADFKNMGEVKIVVDRLDDFVYDYLEYKGQKVKKCEGEECNKRILVRGKANTKYCKECKKEKEREWKKVYIRKRREDMKGEKKN